MIEAYPLSWPEGRPRTPRHAREAARFDTSLARARDGVINQIEIMGGRYTWMKRETALIISSNLTLRQDGLPYANQRQPEDPGVAVYFTYKKRQMCFACDRWTKVEDNMQAIAKTIEALRGIARWGTGDMMEAAFKGFAALPAPGASKHWRDLLDVPDTGTKAEQLARARMHYRACASANHPDKGGDTNKMAEYNNAWDQALKEIG
jgi:hypothetical protein